MNHKELWKEIFGDTDPYIDFYFKEKARRSKIYSQYEEKELASMAFFTPYEVVYKGEVCRFPYIVGVATRKQSRGKGYMKKNLERGLQEFWQMGAKIAFLSPADEKIYTPLGFEGVYTRERLEVYGNQKEWYKGTAFHDLDPSEQKKAALFAGKILESAGLDLYMHRTAPYYQLLHKEMVALDGEVVVLWEGEVIRGVVSYIKEEADCEVTELICDPCNGQKVMESVCAYVGEEEGEKVVFSDPYFLKQISGEGICVTRCEKPYLMAKALDEKVDVSGLKVYINDIT